MNSEFKTCFITGANAGIGKAAAIQIAEKGYRVFIGSRNQERGEKALAEIKAASKSEKVTLVLIDLSSKKSILSAIETLKSKCEALDVLIHNAAAFDISQKKPIYTAEGIESIWMTNHLGPVILTANLLPLLYKSGQGRVITIASKGLIMHPKLKVDLLDPEFKTRKFSVPKAYYQSKLAQVMFTYKLAQKQKENNVTANCIRVTSVKIDISRYPNVSPFMKWIYKLKSKSALTPEQMAKTYTYLATDPELKNITGKYFDENRKQVSSSKYSMDDNNIKDVMKLSHVYLDKLIDDK